MADEYRWRRGTTATLTTVNEQVSSGEVQLELDDSTGTAKLFKVGGHPGPTAYNDLTAWNQYTNAEKAKLAGIATGADVNSITTVFGRTGSVAATTGDYTAAQVSETAAAKIMTSAERTKLAGLPAVFSGESFQTTWNASTNTPTLAGSGMTPGQWWQVSTTGTQFTRTFTAGTHRALVDTAGVLQPVLIGTGAVTSVFTRTGGVVATGGDYTADLITETGTRVFVTPAQKAHIDALPATAAPSAHVGAGGVLEHALATTSVAGFQSADDKINANLFGAAVSESAPTTLPDGGLWVQASTRRIRFYDLPNTRYRIIAAYAETTAPTVNTDSDAGFAEGCFYSDTVGNWVYVCRDNTVGAAVWEKIATPSATSLGATTLVGSTQTNGSIGLKGVAIAGTTGDPAITTDATTVTLNVPTRQSGSEIVSLVDSEFGSQDWHAGAASVQKVIVPHIVFGNTVTNTDMAAAETRMFGNAAIFSRDLTTASRIRLSRTIDGVFGATGSKIYLKYSLNGSTYTTIAGTDVVLDGAAQYVAGTWVDVPALAKTTATFVALYASGGDGAIDPKLKNVLFDVEYPVTTTAGVKSTAFSQVYAVLAGAGTMVSTVPIGEINGHARVPVDLSLIDEIQFSVEVTVAATTPTVVMLLQYSVDGGTVFADIPGSSVTVNVTGSLLSGWATVPAAARIATAWVRIAGGDPATAHNTVTFRQANFATRVRTLTPLLDASPTLVWQPVTMIGGATLNWAAVPVGNALEVNTRMRVWYDTERTSKLKFRTYIATAGKAASVGYLQYSLDASTWTTLSGSTVAMDTIGQRDTGEITLPSEAQNPICWFRFVVDNPASPAGTTSYGIALTILDFLSSVYAEVPWSEQGSPNPPTNLQGPPQTVTADNQAIQAEMVFIGGACSVLLLPPASTNIHKCEFFNTRSSFCNIKPSGGEAIDGVGPSGQDVMPFKSVMFMRQLSGTPTWFEMV